MASYNTSLITWGASGSAYPAGYNYLQGDQPVDAYDNFFNSNVITDIQHLVSLTNARLESSKGTTRPASPEEGELFFDSDDDLLEVYDGAAWQTVSTAGDLASHTSDTTNPHAVTAAQTGAIADTAGSVDESHLSFDVATQVELDTHAGDTGNPHAVTAAQVAAVALSGDTMTGTLDMAGNIICKPAMDPRVDDPATPSTGQMWFRTDLSELRFYDGAAIQIVTTTAA